MVFERRRVAAWLAKKRCLMDVGEGHRSWHSFSMRWLKASSASRSCRSYSAVEDDRIEPHEDLADEAWIERVGELGISPLVSCKFSIAGRSESIRRFPVWSDDRFLDAYKVVINASLYNFY